MSKSQVSWSDSARSLSRVLSYLNMALIFFIFQRFACQIVVFLNLASQAASRPFTTLSRRSWPLAFAGGFSAISPPPSHPLTHPHDAFRCLQPARPTPPVEHILFASVLPTSLLKLLKHHQLLFLFTITPSSFSPASHTHIRNRSQSLFQHRETVQPRCALVCVCLTWSALFVALPPFLRPTLNFVPLSFPHYYAHQGLWCRFAWVCHAFVYTRCWTCVCVQRVARMLSFWGIIK